MNTSMALARVITITILVSAGIPAASTKPDSLSRTG